MKEQRILFYSLQLNFLPFLSYSSALHQILPFIFLRSLLILSYHPDFLLPCPSNFCSSFHSHPLCFFLFVILALHRPLINSPSFFLPFPPSFYPDLQMSCDADWSVFLFAVFDKNILAAQYPAFPDSYKREVTQSGVSFCLQCLTRT
jgi:hypothetical protein